MTGSLAELYAEVATDVVTLSCFEMALTEHFWLAGLAKYLLAAYMADVNFRMRVRWSLLPSATSRTVNADEENGWRKSEILARMLGR